MMKSSIDDSVFTTVCSTLVGTLLALTLPIAGYASDVTQCRVADAPIFCNSRPDVSELPLLTQKDIDTLSPATEAAWAIGGSSTITLPADSEWSPGNSPLNLPTIWIVDNASLIIAGDSSTEVSLNANIFLCDNAELIVDNTALRFNQSASFELFLWATDNSSVRYENAEILTASDTIPFSTLAHFMRGNSVLSGTAANPASLTIPDGSLLLEVLDSAVAEIDSSTGFFESTKTTNASLSFTDTSFVTTGLTVCEAETASLENIPPACDIDVECFSGSHPVTNYNPAGVSNLSINNSQLVSWQFTTLPSSTLNITNASADANMIINLAGEMIETIQLPNNASPVGLMDRTISLNASLLLGWGIIPVGDSLVTIQPGSSLSDVQISDNSQVEILGSMLQFGQVEVFDGQLSLRDTVVDQAVLNLGVLNAANTAFNQVLSTAANGRSILADTIQAEMPFLADDGQLLEMELSTPTEGVIFTDETLDIVGNLQARDSTGTLNPFPEAQVELIPVTTGVPTLLTTLNAPAEDEILTSLDSSMLAEGFYDISLRFSDSNETASVRTIQIAVPPIFMDGFESENTIR